jgi:nucleotide-binding universal stress UspA family protein
MSEQSSEGSVESVTRGAVVVGDDGSPDAARAVRWAHEDALRRGVPLVVIRGWSITTAPRPTTDDLSYVPSEDEFAEAVRAEMAADLARVLGPEPAGTVHLMPVHAPAPEALVHASVDSAVTVVGARGSGLARWLGSVSTEVVHHAHGPVVVLPPVK